MNDIELVNQYQPDYVGFVLAPSKRQITPEMARSLKKQLHGIRSVGVVVDEPIENLLKWIEVSGVDVIQLHGLEDEAYVQTLIQCSKIEIWKAIRVRNKADLSLLSMKGISMFLLDSFHKDSSGGSGKRFNWELLEGIDCRKLWIAGGIDQDNIKEVLKFHPYGIDISSGIETGGCKDEEKVKEIMSEVRL